jgi:AGZA family xanthine/uracil permease-like MFS transporter
MLDRIFRLSESGTTAWTEILAGLTTFLTMSYIIFVQPAVLSTDMAGNPTGLDFGAVLLATCVISAAATIFMGLYARYPIALAPGMGENFFFVNVIMLLAARQVTNAWQVALGIVFISGVIFFILSIIGVREAIIDAVSPSMKAAIGVGIGALIAFIGLRNGAVLTASPGTFVGLNSNLVQPGVAVFGFGLFVTAVLFARRVRGAVLIGIVAAALLAAAFGEVRMGEVPFGVPVIEEHAAFRMDLWSALQLTCVPFIVLFVIMDMFDTTGTLIAVAEQGGFMREGKLPRANRALVVDASATVAGAALGTSTVTSFIESTTGIAYGGRTGLTAVATGVLFLVALLLSPLIEVVADYPPITAPALVMVGALMLSNVRKIEWDDFTECIPAFLMIIGIPLTNSIADGLALGFISYPIIRMLSGRWKQVHWLMYVIALILLAYFIWVRPQLAPT